MFHFGGRIISHYMRWKMSYHKETLIAVPSSCCTPGIEPDVTVLAGDGWLAFIVRIPAEVGKYARIAMTVLNMSCTRNYKRSSIAQTHAFLYTNTLLNGSVILFVCHRNHFPVVQFQNQMHIQNPHGTGQVFKTIWGAAGSPNYEKIL